MFYLGIATLVWIVMFQFIFGNQGGLIRKN